MSRIDEIEDEIGSLEMHRDDLLSQAAELQDEIAAL